MGSTERVWDTTTLAESDQFAFWQDVVWDAFVPVRVSRPGDGPFPSSVSMREVGPLGVALISSQGQSVARTEPEITRRNGGVFFLNLPLTAGTWAAQAGRVAPLRAGDFMLVDSEQPFELGFQNSFEQISLAVPHDLLNPLLAFPCEETAVPVRGDRGVGAVAVAAIQSAAQEAPAMNRREARAISGHLAGLIALAVRGLRATPRATNGRLFLQAALDEIDASLHDPTLAPGTVAERLSISVRYLHKLFSDQGTSFGRWLLGRRLEAARKYLEDPCSHGRTITEVAINHGFGDPAYFARAFKRAYQLTPREYRLRAAAVPSRAT